METNLLNLEELKYPTGKFIAPEKYSKQQIEKWTEEIETLPSRLSFLVQHFSPAQLDTPYRPEGWTVRQVVHHVADSHMNAYTRFHLALTEDHPIIRAYKESLWAELPYLKNLDIQISLHIISSLHARWVLLIKSLSESDLKKTYLHPEYKKTYSLEQAIGMYAWHGNHHLAHISRLKDRNFVT